MLSPRQVSHRHKAARRHTQAHLLGPERDAAQVPRAFPQAPCLEAPPSTELHLTHRSSPDKPAGAAPRTSSSFFAPKMHGRGWSWNETERSHNYASKACCHHFISILQCLEASSGPWWVGCLCACREGCGHWGPGVGIEEEQVLAEARQGRMSLLRKKGC